MTKIFTCGECRYYEETTRTMSVCDCDGKCHDGTDEFCPYFQTKDGKIPRYCRMAQDIDRMAEAIVYESRCDMDVIHWRVNGKESEPYNYESKEQAIEAAKSWLMECEDEK